MTILDFLKKVFSEPEKIEPTKEKIVFSDIENLIQEKSINIKTKESNIISLIKEKIDFFTKELKEKIKIANNVNIESKEKNEKIKSVVYEGRKKYIEFLERFIGTLEDILETNLEEVTENVNLAFTRFNESSGKSYERATILIGKEMGSIKETMRIFSTELIILFKENKDIISISKSLSLIESKLNEIKEINEKSIKIEKETANLTEKIIKKEKEFEEISKKIEDIMKSTKYLDNIETKKSIETKQEEIEKEIYNLKQLIDFKVLTNFFHIFEDKMTIVKAYRDNFKEEFKADKGERLLNLLNESKLNTEQISEKLKQIQEKEQEIENKKRDLKEDETHYLSSELERAKEDIKDLTNEKMLAKKKREKLKMDQESINKIIKEELELMGVKLSL